ncbi:MAG: hypothetical protein ABFE01_11240 [Phycisphaerales bacterium]
MRILTANLRLFYQNVNLWIYYVVVAFLICAAVQIRSWAPSFASRDGILYATLVVVTIPLSQIAAWMPLHIAGHAFGLFLPNHRSVMRRLVFLIGPVVCLIIAAALPGDGIPASRWGEVFCATFFLNLTVFLICAGLMIVTDGIGTIPAIGGLVALCFWAGHLYPTITLLVREEPHSVILFGLVTTVLTWLLLGRQSSRRRDGYVDEIHNSSLFAACREASEPGESLDAVFSWIESRLLHAMTPSRCGCIAGYAIGSLYEELLRFRLAWKGDLARALGLTLWAGYVPSWRCYLAISLAFALSETSHRSIFSHLSFAKGRRERWSAAIASLVARSGLMLSLALLVLLATNLLLPLIPEVKAAGIALRYHPVSLRWLLFLIVSWPVVNLLTLCMAGNPVRKAVAFLVLIAGTSCFLWFFESGRSLEDAPWIIGGLAAGTSWCVYVLGTFWFVRRSDLMRR